MATLLFLLLGGSGTALLSLGGGGGGRLGLGSILVLEDLLHNLLLLQEEGTHDAVAHAAATAGAAIGAGDGLAALGEGGQLVGADGGQLGANKISRRQGRAYIRCLPR